METRTKRKVAGNSLVRAMARTGYLTKGVVYLLIGGLALLVVFGERHAVPGAQTAVRTIGEQPFGRVLLIATGIGLFSYALWRAIQQLPSSRYEHLERRVVTPRELLFQEALTGRFDPQNEQEENRVKAGVNWLERARVVRRTENQVRVFTGRPRLATLAEAFRKVESLDLAPPKVAHWKAVRYGRTDGWVIPSAA